MRMCKVTGKLFFGGICVTTYLKKSTEHHAFCVRELSFLSFVKNPKNVQSLRQIIIIIIIIIDIEAYTAQIRKPAANVQVDTRQDYIHSSSFSERYIGY